MQTSRLFKNLCAQLEEKLQFLDDKPEETPESTVKALWLAASGINASAEKAMISELPRLSSEQENKLRGLIQKRLDRVPLAHLTGRQNFLGIELIADKRALIPRKETELLGKKAIELANLLSEKKQRITVFDVCCGSGNLGIAIATFNQKCTIYASDISQEAVELTRENVLFTNLADRVVVKQSDLFGTFQTDEYFRKVDLIACNPPYITSAKVVKMDAEIVANEPSLAFDGGMLGIKIIQKLVHEAPHFLSPEGWVVLEVGAGQGEFVMKLFEKSGNYKNIAAVSDNAGVIRVVSAQNAQR